MEEAGGELPIELLEGYGIFRRDIIKLKESGFHTIKDVAHAPMKRLLSIEGIHEEFTKRGE